MFVRCGVLCVWEKVRYVIGTLFPRTNLRNEINSIKSVTTNYFWFESVLVVVAFGSSNFRNFNLASTETHCFAKKKNRDSEKNMAYLKRSCLFSILSHIHAEWKKDWKKKLHWNLIRSGISLTQSRKTYVFLLSFFLLLFWIYYLSILDFQWIIEIFDTRKRLEHWYKKYVYRVLVIFVPSEQWIMDIHIIFSPFSYDIDLFLIRLMIFSLSLMCVCPMAVSIQFSCVSCDALNFRSKSISHNSFLWLFSMWCQFRISLKDNWNIKIH